MAIKGASGDKERISPHLIVRNATEAMEFYTRALGAVELYRSPLPGGLGLHLHARIGKTFVMITEETPPSQSNTIDDTIRLCSPQSLGGTTAIFEILVDDVDATYQKALEAGATPVLPVSDCFWGDRYGWVRDPYGHIWALATVLEELTAEEVQRRMDDMMTKMAEMNREP
jgi:PhnB protein